MNKMALVIFFLSTFVAYAATNMPLGQEKTMTCAACHGPKGISVNPEWPSLAGQHVGYLAKQLHDFKLHVNREAATMTPMVASLSPKDMEDIALFYASLPLPENTTPKKYLARGEQLYRGGDFNKHITACIACHGPKGTGNAEAGFPALSGQHATYTHQQLQLFKDNKRKNDLNGIMRDISKRMDADDMEAVAQYVSGLH